MKNFRVRNIFRKPSKKSFGKIGLFLIFSMIVINININSINNSKTKNLNDSENFRVNMTLGIITAEAASVSGAASGLWTFIKTGLSVSPAGLLYSAANGDLKKNLKDNVAKPLLIALNTVLYGVLFAIIELTLIASSLFDFALNVNTFREMLNSDAVYNVWGFVRDFLNLFFMLALLFSAFATVFQVEKYHLKKVIIMLVVMALLTNFSYAIALFVIDLSNSMMMFFVGSSSSNNISSLITNVSGFAESLSGTYDKKVQATSTSTAIIIENIIISFILLITLLAYAVNLIIRMFALIILVIFSPVGFVFSFLPSSATKKIADDWWSSLFKYSFMGPIMAFFLLLAMMFFNNSDVQITAESNFIISKPFSLIDL